MRPLQKERSDAAKPHRFFLCTELFCLRSTNGTYVCAVAAINASVSVDYVFAVAFSDAGYGAFRCAYAAADAIVVNDVSHVFAPPLKGIRQKPVRYFKD